MSPTKQKKQTPKPSKRPRRTAKPAATTRAAAKKTSIIASGPAYFTFTDSGEITITSYELAHALRKAGRSKKRQAKPFKVGIQIGKFGGTAGMYEDTNPPTQGNSMCLCDTNC